jgi:beta-glucanase (GH16 family)
MTTFSRWIAATAFSVALASCASAHVGSSDPIPSRAENGEPYQLVWSDEFDGDGPVDQTKWGFESGFVRNRELQWYQAENAVRQNGILVIEGRREHKPNPHYLPSTDTSAAAMAKDGAWKNRELIEYTSSSINTHGKRAWRYGRFEMRAKIDVRTGSWPAFWVLGTKGPWPGNGEVDIMEFYDDTLLFNVAWGATKGVQWNSVKVPRNHFPADWADHFHVWRMDWDERSIRLFLDDSLMNAQDLSATLNAPQPGAPTNPFHEPAYILVNQAMGGQHGGDPGRSALPLRYEVDYVRVYQTKSQAEGG